MRYARPWGPRRAAEGQPPFGQIRGFPKNYFFQVNKQHQGFFFPSEYTVTKNRARVRQDVSKSKGRSNMTVSNVDEMMVGVCILRGAYPHLDFQDLVEDVRQIARLTAQENLGDAETERAVIRAAVFLIAADKELTPHAAIEMAVRVRKAVSA